MSEIIKTGNEAVLRFCPLGGGANHRNCVGLGCMFWSSTTRMDQLNLGYCSLATLARKICEEDFHVGEILGNVVAPATLVNDGVRRIDRPIQEGEEMVATPVNEEGIAGTETHRLQLRRPNPRNQN